MRIVARWRDNPRPDTVRAWLTLRVWLLAALGGSGHWTAFAAVVLWAAGDYAVWFWRTTN